MKTFKSILSTFLKGIIIGIGLLIPGLSGGTIAVTVGLFEKLLESVANICKNFKKSVIFLLNVGLGVILGILMFSSIIKELCKIYSYYANYIFCLIAIISAIFFIKKSIGFRNIKIFYFIIGVTLSVLISLLLKTYQFNTFDNFVSLFILGFPLAFALVLPAISFSYMMLFFGIYESFLNAISKMDLLFLTPLSLGIIIGTYILSNLLNNLINEHPKETYSFVFGFVCISIIDIIT